MELPSYPDAGDSGDVPAGGPEVNWAARIVIGVVVTLVVVVIELHLTGVVGPLGN
jgi:hypothetical protein